jgi:MFS family permease
VDVGAIGRSSSIYQSLYDIGAMAGPYGLGAIASVAGYGLMFVVSGLLALVGAIYFVAKDPDAGIRRVARRKSVLCHSERARPSQGYSKQFCAP